MLMTKSVLTTCCTILEEWVKCESLTDQGSVVRLHGNNVNSMCRSDNFCTTQKSTAEP